MKKYIAVAALMFVGSANAAGFNCALASTPVENMICSDATLSQLDEDLNAAYKEAVKLNPTVKVDQRAWVRNVRNVEVDLESAYRRRITDMKSVQVQAAPVQREQEQAQIPAGKRHVADKKVEQSLLTQGNAFGLAKTCLEDFQVTDEEYNFFKTTVISELKQEHGNQYDSNVMKLGYISGYDLGKNLKVINYSDFSDTCNQFRAAVQKLQNKKTVVEEDFE